MTSTKNSSQGSHGSTTLRESSTANQSASVQPFKNGLSWWQVESKYADVVTETIPFHDVWIQRTPVHILNVTGHSLQCVLVWIIDVEYAYEEYVQELPERLSQHVKKVSFLQREHHYQLLAHLISRS